VAGKPRYPASFATDRRTARTKIGAGDRFRPTKGRIDYPPGGKLRMKSEIKIVARLAGCAMLAFAAPAIASEGMWMPGQATEIGEAMRADGLQLDPGALGRFDATSLNAIISLGEWRDLRLGLCRRSQPHHPCRQPLHTVGDRQDRRAHRLLEKMDLRSAPSP